MRTAIVYYSFTGNTNRTAHIIADMLRYRGEDVVPIRIRPLKEEKHFLAQCRDAFMGKKPELYKTLLDLNGFDKVIFGSPVWAFKPAPAINAYIDKCSSLEGKKAVCFVTYGSGAGKEKTLENMKKALQAKGANVIQTVSFQQTESPASSREKLDKIL